MAQKVQASWQATAHFSDTSRNCAAMQHNCVVKIVTHAVPGRTIRCPGVNAKILVDNLKKPLTAAHRMRQLVGADDDPTIYSGDAGTGTKTKVGSDRLLGGQVR